MKVICFPSGILNWGFDKILQAHPELGTDNKHEMNPFKEESWKWLYRVFDYAADNYDIDGFHLEAADQGRCKTPECMENWPDNVAYYCYVTGRLADYLRQKHRHMLLVTTIQGFSTWGKGFSAEQVERIVDLSKKVDCMFDQGHRGTYVSPSDWVVLSRNCIALMGRLAASGSTPHRGGIVPDGFYHMYSGPANICENYIKLEDGG